MKKFIVLFGFVAFFATGLTFSQDIIIKNDKTEIKAKIVEIQEEFIKYTLFDSPSGPLRNIRISDVFMIIYQDGTRETFTAKSETKQAEEPVVQPAEQPAQQEAKPPQDQPSQETEPAPLGYIVQGHLGISIPYNESVSEIYKYLPLMGISSGYWGKWFGLESILEYSRMNGEAITQGNVQDAKAVLKITSITFCGYFAANSTKKSFFYVGGGIGYAYVKEKVSATLNGQYGEDEVNLDAIKISVKCGMKVHHFFWELDSSDVLSSDTEIDFGGFSIKAGFYF